MATLNSADSPVGKATIQTVAQLIAEQFDPEKIILFGSYARGQAGMHGDMDLLVVMRDDEGRKHPGIRIRRAIAQRFVLPVDVIVSSPEVFARQRTNPYSLIHKALEEGELLYERPTA